MKRQLVAIGGLVGFCTAVLVVGVSCDTESNPQAISILGNVLPDKEAGICVVRTSGGGQQAFLGGGILDLSITTSYGAFLMITNEFPDFESLTGFKTEHGRLDSGTIRLRKLNVTYSMDPALAASAAANAPALFTSLEISGDGTFSTSVPASGNVAPNSQGVAIADIVPEHVGQFLRAIPALTTGEKVNLVLDIQVEGLRADNATVKSGSFHYPITVCNNCLVFSNLSEASARQPFVATPPDDQPAATSLEDLIGDACAVGNDSAISNGICGAGFADECQLQRCLGLAAPPGMVALTCPNDKFAVPVQ